MLRCEEIIFLKDDSIFVLVGSLVIIKRCKRPDLVKTSEVPIMRKKILEYVRGPELAISE